MISYLPAAKQARKLCDPQRETQRPIVTHTSQREPTLPHHFLSCLLLFFKIGLHVAQAGLNLLTQSFVNLYLLMFLALPTKCWVPDVCHHLETSVISDSYYGYCVIGTLANQYIQLTTLYPIVYIRQNTKCFLYSCSIKVYNGGPYLGWVYILHNEVEYSIFKLTELQSGQNEE